METRGTIAALVAVVAIAGCGGAAAPPTPTPSPTAATTASPTRVTSTSRPTPAPTPATPLNETTTLGAAQPARSKKITMVRLDFEPPKTRVRAGKVVFYLMNRAQRTGSHNMAIAASRGTRVLARSDIVLPLQAAVFTINDLPRGTYYFFCEVVPHEQNGMTGTLTAE